MLIPNKIKKGDTIGVVAPSNPIINENIEEIEKAKKIIEKLGYKVKFSKNLFSNTLEYSSTPKEKAEDINEMFKDKFDKIKGIWIGNYEHESGVTLEKIISDVLDTKHKFPIIKSNNFGHTETKTVIPIGTKAKIDTTKEIKIELTEKCVK